LVVRDSVNGPSEETGEQAMTLFGEAFYLPLSESLSMYPLALVQVEDGSFLDHDGQAS
jgi:hypothetical protein